MALEYLVSTLAHSTIFYIEKYSLKLVINNNIQYLPLEKASLQSVVLISNNNVKVSPLKDPLHQQRILASSNLWVFSYNILHNYMYESA